MRASSARQPDTTLFLGVYRWVLQEPLFWVYRFVFGLIGGLVGIVLLATGMLRIRGWGNLFAVWQLYCTKRDRGIAVIHRHRTFRREVSFLFLLFFPVYLLVWRKIYVTPASENFRKWYAVPMFPFALWVNRKNPWQAHRAGKRVAQELADGNVVQFAPGGGREETADQYTFLGESGDLQEQEARPGDWERIKTGKLLAIRTFQKLTFRVIPKGTIMVPVWVELGTWFLIFRIGKPSVLRRTGESARRECQRKLLEASGRRK